MIGRFSLSSAVLLGVLIAVGATAGAFDLHGRVVGGLDGWPIRSVRVGGQLDHVSRARLQGAVRPHLAGGFLGVDVVRVADAARRLPWVASVSVRRVWPDSLHIAVIERKAVARWGIGGLVAANGSVFRPNETGPVEHLPLLSGPPGTSARLLDLLERAGKSLDGVGAGIALLSVSEQGVWRIRCINGIEIIFREPQFPMLAELARIYEPLLGERTDEMLAIDLRYTNGFAVRWKIDASAVEDAVQGDRKGNQG